MDELVQGAGDARIRIGIRLVVHRRADRRLVRVGRIEGLLGRLFDGRRIGRAVGVNAGLESWWHLLLSEGKTLARRAVGRRPAGLQWRIRHQGNRHAAHSRRCRRPHAPLVLWRVYSRIKRLTTRQRSKVWRHRTTLVFFPAAAPDAGRAEPADFADRAGRPGRRAAGGPGAGRIGTRHQIRAGRRRILLHPARADRHADRPAVHRPHGLPRLRILRAGLVRAPRVRDQPADPVHLRRPRRLLHDFRGRPACLAQAHRRGR
jgi:hypothetical protein